MDSGPPDTTPGRPGDTDRRQLAAGHDGETAHSSARADARHRFLSRCLFLAVLWLTGQWCWLNLTRPAPLPWRDGAAFGEFFRVEINSATWVEWIQLKGIGETMAHRIVADRDVHGPFRSIDDLQRVDGIGPATLDQIRPWLTISHDVSTKLRHAGSNKSAGKQPRSF